MVNLVPIPWQPGYYLTPDTLAYLVAAGKKLGTQLIVTDAWRRYAEQAYYYDQYLHHGGPPASSPDTGQRNHMRGAAFDLARTDATVQAACRSVGLIRDAAETWHWNNPNWANMPIIPTNTSTGTTTTSALDGTTKSIIKSITEEGNMRYIFNSRRGGALLGPLGVILLPNPEEAATASAFFNGVDVTERQFDVLKQVLTKYAMNAKAVLK